MEPYSDAPGAQSEFDIGQEFIVANGEQSFWFFTWARWACIPFSLLGGYGCFRWARELYGDWSGLLALTLWCFDPNILANGQLITPDMGTTALAVTSAYAFREWLKRPGWWRALGAGVALGLALLTKTTWIILFALWPALWLVWRLPAWHETSKRAWGGQCLQLGATLLLGLYLLNMGYCFEGSLERLDSHQFVSGTLAGPAVTEVGREASGNRFAGTWLGEIPMPVPRNYLLGIDVQKHDFESHFNSYLRGEWRKEGWWYYYLYALTIKVPLGVWALAALAVVLGLFRRGYAAAWRGEVTVLAPAVLLLAFVSSQTGFNHHSRYVLPIFPFFFIWMSKVGRAFERKERLPAVLTAGAMIWAVASSLLVYPHSLSYFNELAGGPANGHAHLLDGNIDWGQDLFYLRDWLKGNPEARPLHLAYFGEFDPRVAGIEFSPPPKSPTNPEEASVPDARGLGPHPGWYAVSVAMLRGCEFGIPDGRGSEYWSPLNNYAYFQRFRPDRPRGMVDLHLPHYAGGMCSEAAGDGAARPGGASRTTGPED